MRSMLGINLKSGLALAALSMGLVSCIHTNKNSPGWEYMPDMYRSPAVEAYVDYGQIRDTLHPDLMNTMSARHPAAGTIPFSASKINDMPYPYPNTQEGYEEAGKELHTPLIENDSIRAKGKFIFENFCMHCHGQHGQGDGLVVTVGGHPAPPAYNGPLKDLPEGKMFQTLTYGKGVMGSHASQLTKVERWEVISYVKVLQHYGEKKQDTPSKSASDSTKTASVDSTAASAGKKM